jgi:hypothetical protein
MFPNNNILLVLLLFGLLFGTVISANIVDTTYPFHVIGSGLGRTGTHTLHMALNQLNLGKTHHMVEVMRHYEFNDWAEAGFETNNVTKRREKLHSIIVNGGYHSAVDYPAAHFYQDLMEIFPNAKVILTIRDSSKDWIRSAKSSVFLNYICHTTSPLQNGYYYLCPGLVAADLLFVPLWPFQRMISVFISKERLGDFSDEYGMRMYDEWNEQVKRVVPSHRLLVFNVKQGWEPLCKFLNLPIPNTPFPVSNDTAEFQFRMRVIATVGWLCVIIILGGTIWLIRKMISNSSIDSKKKKV